MSAVAAKYDVPSLRAGMRMLDHLSFHPGGRTLKDLATELDCPLSSAFRIAAVLESMGVVSREADTKRIRLTPKLLEIGQRAVTESNLLEHALDVMRELRDRVEDTVLIGVRDGAEVVVLDQVTGSRMFCFVSKLGFRVPAYCSAPGKAMLAHLPPDELKGLIAAISFVRFNRRTPATPRRLREHLAAARTRGFAFDDSEQFEGVYCVGAPVFDRAGYPVASVWTTGLMMDLDRRKLPELGAVVRSHADRISARLGFAATAIQGARP